MTYILPKLAPNEKFHSVIFDNKSRPFAAVQVFVRENLPEEKYWIGHTRIKLVPFTE